MSAARAFSGLGVLAFVVCVFPLSTHAQQAPNKPGQPKPLVLRPLQSNCGTDSGPLEVGNLPDFAARLLHHAPDAGCPTANCKILVTDFVFPDGSAFPSGIQWADDLSSLFAKQEKMVQVVDRSLLRELLQNDAISEELQNSEPAARWLGKQFSATVVLVGRARMITGDVVELSARFLNANDKNLIGPSSEVDLAIVLTGAGSPPTFQLPGRALSPTFRDMVNGEKVYQPGTEGVRFPACYQMPTPSYTEAAIDAHFSGIVTAEAVVGSDGVVRNVQLVKGAPFGLSEQVIKTIRTWKCKPAVRDGKPVATIVPFETNFRGFGAN